MMKRVNSFLAATEANDRGTKFSDFNLLLQMQNRYCRIRPGNLPSLLDAGMLLLHGHFRPSINPFDRRNLHSRFAIRGSIGMIDHDVFSAWLHQDGLPTWS